MTAEAGGGGGGGAVVLTAILWVQRESGWLAGWLAGEGRGNRQLTF